MKLRLDAKLQNRIEQKMKRAKYGKFQLPLSNIRSDKLRDVSNHIFNAQLQNSQRSS